MDYKFTFEDGSEALMHYGVRGMKWGVWNEETSKRRTGSHTKALSAVNGIYTTLNKFDYGVEIDGKRYNETNLDQVDWSKYRTQPVEQFEKSKIGTCWDYTNYQHKKLKDAGIDHDTHMIVMKTGDGPDDIVTHTFTTFKDKETGKNYWLEQALWKKRGVHEIDSFEDAAKEIASVYDKKGRRPFDVYRFNPDGMDKGLNDQQFFAKATKKDPVMQRTDDRLFVSGSSKTQNKDSEYYRKNLPKPIRKELKNAMKSGSTILVGDAPGIDRQVQDYLHKKKYKNVEVYSPGTQARYKAGKEWTNHLVNDTKHEPGSKEWLAKKDVAMTNASSRGLAVVLDNGANATRNNVKRLREQGKDAVVYMLSSEGKRKDRWTNDV